MPNEIAFADHLPPTVCRALSSEAKRLGFTVLGLAPLRLAAAGELRHIAFRVQPLVLHLVRGGFAASLTILAVPEAGRPPLAEEYS